jgi:hypothetical protein
MHLFTKYQSKQYLINKILNLLKISSRYTKNKKNRQRINICYRLLKKIICNDYMTIAETQDLDQYLLKLNDRKKQQKKNIELFSKILSDYILYAQD